MTPPFISDADREQARTVYLGFDDEKFMDHGQRLFDLLSVFGRPRIPRPTPKAILIWTREALRRGLLFDAKPTERVHVEVTFNRPAGGAPCAA